MISPHAIIHPKAVVAKEATVHPFAIICEHALIGGHATIGHNCFIGKGVTIEDHAKLEGNVYAPPGVEILEGAFVGPGVTFCNVKHPPLPEHRKGAFEKTIVYPGAVIGAGCTILPGVIIEAGVRIGAGSVVTRSLATPPDPERWYVGNPARLMKELTL